MGGFEGWVGLRGGWGWEREEDLCVVSLMLWYQCDCLRLPLKGSTLHK